MYSKYRIGNTKLNSKLPIVIFEIDSISLIESENLGKPRLTAGDHCEGLTSVTQQLVLDTFEIFIAETDVQPVNMESAVATCFYSN